MAGNAPIKIFSGTQTRYLAEKISSSADLHLGRSSCPVFSDGEFEPCYEETIRGSHCFIVQSTFPPADNILELLLMIDAAKRASAYKIIAVIPYFGYARQDRKDKPRVSIGAKLMADMLSAAGIDRLITMDLHADQIQGFFDVPVDHLTASTLFIPHIRKMNLENLVVASPDVGGTKRANTYAKLLGTDMVICHKSRSQANVVGNMTVIGDVKGKDVVIIDDMIDTAGTIAKAANLMKEKGANSVRAFATHAVLSGPAYERIDESDLDEIYFTDSIPLRKKSEKIKIISCSGLIADVIQKVYKNESISTSFI
ncbi:MULTISPECIES: ribose-phosphate pyrophosphokinase [Prolixibacter]|uniref:ribose-phosphate diphosphokinase n=1 Tax=Prolixibacter denitrificans TaxID=1541063 RepID=A0A2P8CCV3_9BACT|nr:MULTISPECIES: ribose-phosphate pyrophosphokinase [Prolixibacter]PSK82803.1 ribose-phosphate pyrophosphokinase [Prolixibacter denitrificans]GET21382.1 ribose-phosphate pyrophosphokinase [Prolixibacter denitrificans]GET23921.1 ribose-phosphate pyrophosphokinase [Prolixibacter sp. NT017]